MVVMIFLISRVKPVQRSRITRQQGVQWHANVKEQKKSCHSLHNHDIKSMCEWTENKQNWHLIWTRSEHCNNGKTIDSCPITMWPIIPALQYNSFGEEPKCNHIPATIFPSCHSCNFWLFSRIKTGLKGHCFMSAGKIQCKTTAGLIAIPKEDFTGAS